MVSTAGLEPARVSPHAPQTCAYTDSATSTQVFLVIQLSNFLGVFVAEMLHFASHPSQKTILNRFFRQSATSAKFIVVFYYHKINIRFLQQNFIQKYILITFYLICSNLYLSKNGATSKSDFLIYLACAISPLPLINGISMNIVSSSKASKIFLVGWPLFGSYSI